jgi:phage/plasmid-like protein (TIGR03299 family)
MNTQDRVQEILVANGLNFAIEKAPMFAMDSKGNQVASEYFGLINTQTNEVINTVKEGYTVSQNEEVVELVLRGIEPFGSDISVTKGGSLNGGRKVFLQLAINGDGKVGNDTIKKYITIVDSNDGSTGLSVGIGDFTMSCANQFFKFYKSGQSKFRHTASLERRIKEIPFLIETALSESLKQIELYNQFASTQVSRDLANKMVKHLLGFDKVYTSVKDLSEKSTRSINKMEAIYNAIEREMNSKGDTLWGLHSGITYYTTHELSAPKRDNGKTEILLQGNGYNLNQASLEFASQLVY